MVAKGMVVVCKFDGECKDKKLKKYSNNDFCSQCHRRLPYKKLNKPYFVCELNANCNQQEYVTARYASRKYGVKTNVKKT